MTALAPQSLPEAEQLAARLAQSALIPDTLRGKPGDVLVVLLTGLELGLSPMQALRGVYVVKGRPVLAADTLVALCKRSPACLYFRCITSTPETATYETQRQGDPEPTRLTWTQADAKRAGLGGGTWQAHPAAMLRHRCAAALARDVYPDLVLGLYEESEGAELAVSKVEVIPAPERRPAPTVEVPKALPAAADLTGLREAIAAASDLAALERLVPELSKLAAPEREAVRPDYAKRKTELTAKPAEAAEVTNG